MVVDLERQLLAQWGRAKNHPALALLFASWRKRRLDEQTHDASYTHWPAPFRCPIAPTTTCTIASTSCTRAFR